jgi:hyaluronan synthase
MLIFLADLFNGEYGLYVIFAFIAWFVWTVRLGYSLGYKPWINRITDPRVTVLVPTYRESREVLTKTINCLFANRINRRKLAEIVIVIDERETEIEEWLNEKFPSCKVLVAPAGKRWAVRAGIEAAMNERVIIIESDTFADPDAIQELLRPLEDPTVGGVVGYQRVYEPKENICTRLNDWMENMKYRITAPGLSINGVVNVLGGRMVAFRRQAVLPLLPRLTGETFLGKPCIPGDDGRLTSLLLEAGWKTIFQSSSHSYTVSPNTWKSLVKQRLRWQRNANRRIINAFKDRWVFKRHWTLVFQMVTASLMPFFFGIIIAKTFKVLVIDPFIVGNWEAGLIRIVIFIIGISITRGMRTFPHLSHARYDLPLLPFYALYLIALMWPVKIYSFATMNKQGWMTRKVVSPGGLG